MTRFILALHLEPEGYHSNTRQSSHLNECTFMSDFGWYCPEVHHGTNSYGKKIDENTKLRQIETIQYNSCWYSPGENT